MQICLKDKRHLTCPYHLIKIAKDVIFWFKELDGIPDGIAAFETTLEEYEAVGGERASDQVRKSDLLAILPGRLQADLLWHSTDVKLTYGQFRDEIPTQSARIADLNKRLPG